MVIRLKLLSKVFGYQVLTNILQPIRIEDSPMSWVNTYCILQIHQIALQDVRGHMVECLLHEVLLWCRPYGTLSGVQVIMQDFDKPAVKHWANYDLILHAVQTLLPFMF